MQIKKTGKEIKLISIAKINHLRLILGTPVSLPYYN